MLKDTFTYHPHTHADIFTYLYNLICFRLDYINLIDFLDNVSFYVEYIQRKILKICLTLTNLKLHSLDISLLKFLFEFSKQF